MSDPDNTIRGTSASETLRGTSGKDRIIPNGGIDTIYGNGGDDQMNGYLIEKYEDSPVTTDLWSQDWYKEVDFRWSYWLKERQLLPIHR